MDLENLSEDELYDMITEKYGEGWRLKDVDATDPIVEEFIKRIATGV